MIKSGVRVLGLQIEIALAATILQSLFTKIGYEFIITSAIEGTHKRASLHYSGNAIDIRSSVVPEEEKIHLLQMMKTVLGYPDSDYDVILEADHYHVEYQPKKPY